MLNEKYPTIGQFSPLQLMQTEGSFLQSKAWANFQSSVGKKVVTIPTSKGDIYGFVHALPFGLSYLYIPHVDCTSDLLEKILTSARTVNAMFVRLEPLSQPVTDSQYTVIPTFSRQPAYSLCIALQPEEDMLQGMHSKTRYNIGLSERKGVVVKEEKDAGIFWNLLRETTARDGFRAHEKVYYENMLRVPTVRQYIAFANSTPVASIVTITHGHTTTYLHGASLHEYRNVMAPYALQWQAMKDAFHDGGRSYDMWGVAPTAEAHSPHAETFHTYTWNTSHSFHGITRFKAGFGGVPIVHPQAVEISLRPLLYHLYRIRQRLIH